MHHLLFLFFNKEESGSCGGIFRQCKCYAVHVHIGLAVHVHIGLAVHVHIGLASLEKRTHGGITILLHPLACVRQMYTLLSGIFILSPQSFPLRNFKEHLSLQLLIYNHSLTKLGLHHVSGNSCRSTLCAVITDSSCVQS